LIVHWPIARDPKVWASNLKKEFDLISRMAEHFSYVGIHTEFPVVFSLPFQMSDEQGYHSQTLNINLLRVMQIGVTLGDASRNVAVQLQVLAFGGHSHGGRDQDLRKGESGFHQLARDGIDVVDFSHLLLASGLVMSDDIFCVAFHGSYNFAYLLKTLTGGPLPAAEEEFLESFQLFFPHFYDVRQIAFIEEQRMS
jgi:CCR4-NOT transcription complex subunit 7/8